MLKRYSFLAMVLLLMTQSLSTVEAQCSCSTFSTPKEDFGSICLLRDVVVWHSFTFGGRNAAGTVISGCEDRTLTSAGLDCFAPVVNFSLPAGPRAEMSAIYFPPNGKVYLFGGTDGVTDFADVWELDPVTYTWVAKAPMSMERSASGVTVIGNKIYVVGGRRSSTVLDLLEEYDPFTNTWAIKTPMSTPRYALEFHGGASAWPGILLNRGFAMGGIDGSGFVTNLNEAYTPATDSWAPAAPMPVALAWFGGFQAAGTYGSPSDEAYYIGVMGGENSAGLPVSSQYMYMTIANTWVTPGPWGFPALCTPVSHHEVFMTGVTGADPIFWVFSLGGREAGPVVRDLIRFHGGLAVMANDEISLQGNWSDGVVELQWAMEGAHRVDRYVVEGETSSGEFADLNMGIQCSGTCGGAQYSVRLEASQSGHAHYRVSAVLLDGSVLHSNVVKVADDEGGPVSIWVENELLNVKGGQGFVEEAAQLSILSLEGRVLLRGEKPAHQDTWSVDCAALSRGIYLVEIRSDKGTVIQKFLR